MDVSRVLRSFLDEMNVRVEELTDDKASALRDSDLVVMASEMVDEMRASFQNLHIFPVHDKNTRMDRTLTQLGILFTENVDIVRKAIAAVHFQPTEGRKLASKA